MTLITFKDLSEVPEPPEELREEIGKYFVLRHEVSKLSLQKELKDLVAKLIDDKITDLFFDRSYLKLVAASWSQNGTSEEATELVDEHKTTEKVIGPIQITEFPKLTNGRVNCPACPKDYSAQGFRSHINKSHVELVDQIWPEPDELIKVKHLEMPLRILKIREESKGLDWYNATDLSRFFDVHSSVVRDALRYPEKILRKELENLKLQPEEIENKRPNINSLESPEPNGEMNKQVLVYLQGNGTSSVQQISEDLEKSLEVIRNTIRRLSENHLVQALPQLDDMRRMQYRLSFSTEVTKNIISGQYIELYNSVTTGGAHL